RARPTGLTAPAAPGAPPDRPETPRGVPPRRRYGAEVPSASPADDPTLAVEIVDEVPSGLQAAAARHPVGMVWFGVVLFSLGPVLVADAGISGTAFSFWRLWIGVGILATAGAIHRRLTGATSSARG